MGVGYNPRVVTNGLVGYWDAGSSRSYPGSGNSWFDLSGNVNTGTLNGSPTFSNTNGGKITFNGTDQRVLCGNASNLQITVGTICVWFNATNLNSSYRGIFAKQGAWGLFVKSNVLISYDWGNSGDRTTGITVGNNSWNYCALSFTETIGTPANNARVYLNGTLIANTTAPGTARSANSGIRVAA